MLNSNPNNSVNGENIFDEWLQNSFQKESEYFFSINEKGTLVWALKGSCLDPNTPQLINKLCHEQIHCKCCSKRMTTLVTLRGKKGSIFPFNPFSSLSDTEDKNWIKTLSDLCSEDLECITGVNVITEPCLFSEYEGTGKGNNTDPFAHFNSWSPIVSDPKINATEFEAVVHKYLPLMLTMFNNNGKPGIHAYLDIACKLLKEEVNYGETLLKSARWFREHIVENFSQLYATEKANIVINALFSTQYESGPNINDPIVTTYHQTNNTILMLLEVAYNVEAFKSLAEKLLYPENYQRRDPNVVLSDNVIHAAITKLGDFTNTLMTVDDALDKFGATKIPRTDDEEKKEDNLKDEVDLTSSLSVMNNMLKSTSLSNSKNDKNKPENEKIGAANFANKVGFVGNKVNLPKTLMDMLNDPPLNLEIRVDDMQHYVKAVTTTLGNEKVTVPFLWEFVRKSPREINLKGWCKVLAVLPLLNKSFIFVCKGAIHTPNSNCCIEEFLSVAYRRECGKVFAQLNTKTKTVVPANYEGDFVLGVGASVSINTDEFINTIHFRSQGVEFKISNRG